MSKMTFPKLDDSLALQYISERGYASYSSLKNVRDCKNPYEPFERKEYFDVGTELDANWLLGISKIPDLSPENRKIVDGMHLALQKHKMASLLRADANTQAKIDMKLEGVPFIGYIDIQKPKYDADLKTFWHSNPKQFIADQDFLQAACYMKADKKSDFFYIGASKEKPLPGKLHLICTYSVLHFPARIKASQKELHTLLKYVKKKCF